MRGFINFIREQGVVGLAVGFILGGAISKVVSGLVTDIINPLLGIVLGAAGDLKSRSWWLSGSEIKYGDFIGVLIDFLIISLVVYVGVKIIGIDRLDRKKETK